MLNIPYCSDAKKNKLKENGWDDVNNAEYGMSKMALLPLTYIQQGLLQKDKDIVVNAVSIISVQLVPCCLFSKSFIF